MATAKANVQRFLGMSSKSAAKRMLECLDDDSLLRMLIEIARDFHVVGTPHYQNEKHDVNEVIREILWRMHNGSRNIPRTSDSGSVSNRR